MLFTMLCFTRCVSNPSKQKLVLRKQKTFTFLVLRYTRSYCVVFGFFFYHYLVICFLKNADLHYSTYLQPPDTQKSVLKGIINSLLREWKG